MTRRGKPADVLRGWLDLAGTIEKALEGLGEQDLDLRGGEEGWSIRETVHHIVEANLVASNVLIAGLARSNHVYDCSWVHPDASWMKRLGYHKVSPRAALQALAALSKYLAELIQSPSDGLLQPVRLLEEAGAEPDTRTIEELLEEQIEHAEGHLRTIAGTRRSHRR